MLETLSKVPKNTSLDIFSLKLSTKDTIPDNFVFLSNKSTYIDALIDNNTTAAASAK